jgi:hypothetical protein
MRTLAILVILVLAGHAPAFALHRCVGLDGKVSLQDRPCDSNQLQTTIRRPSPSGIELTPAQRDVQRVKAKEAAEKAQIDRDMRVNDAILRQQVVVGMTEEEVRRAQGEPTQINRGSQGEAQWVFQDKGWARHVYLQNGLVRSFQTR